MKALLLKEIRQGKMILLFGPALALLLLLLRPVLPRLFSFENKVSLDSTLFYMAIGGTFLMALIAGAGLFSAEMDRGTLSVLLGLPLSRTRLWLTKMTAGLVLALVSSFLLLLPAYLFFWHFHHKVILLSDTLVFLFWWLAVYFITLFCSILLEHTISAFLVAALFSLGLFILTGITVSEWGGLLTGRLEGLFDTGLWVFSLLPACLIAALLAVKKGELLRGRRKWLVALPVFLLTSGLTVTLIIGAFRYGLRYQRDKAEEVWVENRHSWNGLTLCLLAKSSPVLMHGEQNSKGQWMASKMPEYSNRHLVILDLKSVRELLVAHATEASVSKKGNLAALLTEPPILTWRAENDNYYSASRGKLVIWDLQKDKEIWSETKEKLAPLSNLSDLAWSPKVNWLALISDNAFLSDILHAPNECTLLVLRPKGSIVTKFPLLSSQAWTWVPADQGLYGFDDKARLQYLSLPQAQRTFLWSPSPEIKLPENYQWANGRITPSSDGKLLAVQIIADLTSREGKASRQSLIFDFLIDRASGKATLLYQSKPISWSLDYNRPKFIWSRDGKQLYFITGLSIKEANLQLFDIAQKKITTLPLPEKDYIGKLEILPTTGELLVWGAKNIFLIDQQGKIKHFPNKQLAARAGDYSWLGLDEAGRAIVLQMPIGNHNHIDAVDLTTGKLTQIYP